MIRHLYIRIYLTTLASLVVVVALCALGWRYTAEPGAQAEHDRLIAAVLARLLPPGSPQSLQSLADQMLVPPVAGIAVFDAQGRRLAASGTLSRWDHLDPRYGSHFHMAGAVHVVHLDDGRTVVARMQSQALQAHLDGLALIVLIAVAVGIGTYPFVRRLTRRLEILAATVDDFGRGQLQVRAATAGNDEMSRLAASFNGMADRVAGLLEAHRGLLANASHELRSPLARLRLALDLYEKKPDPALMADMRRDCAEIDGQIEEILLASKLDTVQTDLTRERADLGVLLAEEASRLGVPCEVVPAEVRGDARLLRRLIRNLLDNAFKHGVQGVEADVVIDDEGNRLLHVSDRGPGIVAAERERIFEPFYRPAQSAESGSGWGLGLSLVRQIADHHGGSVRCLAREGGGCVFELRIPAPDAG